MFVTARTRQYPSALSSARGASLKAVGKRFDPRGESLQRLRDGGIGRRRHRIGMPAPARISLMSSAMSKAANSSWRVSVRLPSAAVASWARRSTLAATEWRCVLLAVTAGDIVAAAGDLDVDIGHQSRLRSRAAGRSGRSRPRPWCAAPDGRREAGEGRRNRRRGRPGPGGRRLDSRERPLDAANGSQGAFIAMGQGIAWLSRPASRHG